MASAAIPSHILRPQEHRFLYPSLRLLEYTLSSITPISYFIVLTSPLLPLLHLLFPLPLIISLIEVGFNIYLRDRIRKTKALGDQRVAPTEEESERIWRSILRYAEIDGNIAKGLQEWTRGFFYYRREEDIVVDESYYSYLKLDLDGWKDQLDKFSLSKRLAASSGTKATVLKFLSRLRSWMKDVLSIKTYDHPHEADYHSFVKKHFQDPSFQEFLHPTKFLSEVPFSEIGIENIREILAARVFYSDLTWLLKPSSSSTQAEEKSRILLLLDVYVAELLYFLPESSRPKPGYNPFLGCMRKTVEPLRIQSQPLIFYLFFEGFRALSQLSWRVIGFRKKKTEFESVWGGRVTMEWWIHEGFRNARNDWRSKTFGLLVKDRNIGEGTPIVVIPGFADLPFFSTIFLRTLFKTGDKMILLPNDWAGFRLNWYREERCIGFGLGRENDDCDGTDGFRTSSTDVSKRKLSVIKEVEEEFDFESYISRSRSRRSTSTDFSRRSSSTSASSSFSELWDSYSQKRTSSSLSSVTELSLEPLDLSLTYPVLTRMLAPKHMFRDGKKYQLLTPVLHVEDKVKGLVTILKEEGIQSIVTLSHSHGSFLATTFERFRPHMVKAQILLEPTALGLLGWRVVRNAAFTKPCTGRQLMLRLTTLEPGLATYIMRHLKCWESTTQVDVTPGVLSRFSSPYEHYLSASKSHVLLSSEDVMVDSHEARILCEKGGIHYVWLEGVGHGEMLTLPFPFTKAVKLIDDVLENTRDNSC